MKAKGLIVKDFPKHWTNWQNPDKPNSNFTKEEIELNNKLLIEKRPYFMKYLYPKYKTQYNEHIKRYDYLSNRLFGISIQELLNIKNKTKEQQDLEDNYNKFNPFLETSCPMNNICTYMEKEVKEIKINVNKKNPEYIFDILFNKSIEITQDQIEKMERVYKRYKRSKTKGKTITDCILAEQGETIVETNSMDNSNLDYISDDIQRLANLAVYINYFLYPTSPKNFCWDLFGEGIVLNIYENSNKTFFLPLLDDEGQIEYMGKRYQNKEVKIECQ